MGWFHIGGGCLVGSTDRYPCDDAYENESTGEVVTFETTASRHFDMPSRVQDLSAVKKLSGVGSEIAPPDFNGLEAPVGAPAKVWVEAETTPEGDVALTLRDIRWRRHYVKERGRHVARMAPEALRRYGFPMQFFDELEKGYPVQFRMNLIGFEKLLGVGG